MVVVSARITAITAISATGAPARSVPVNDGARPVFVDHLDDVPTKTLDHLGSVNVFHVLASIGAMVIAVVLEGHHRLFPSEVEVGHTLAVGDVNLGHGPR